MKCCKDRSNQIYPTQTQRHHRSCSGTRSGRAGTSTVTIKWWVTLVPTSPGSTTASPSTVETVGTQTHGPTTARIRTDRTSSLAPCSLTGAHWASTAACTPWWWPINWEMLTWRRSWYSPSPNQVEYGRGAWSLDFLSQVSQVSHDIIVFFLITVSSDHQLRESKRLYWPTKNAQQRQTNTFLDHKANLVLNFLQEIQQEEKSTVYILILNKVSDKT